MSELNLKGVLSNAYGKSGGLFSILLLMKPSNIPMPTATPSYRISSFNVRASQTSDGITNPSNVRLQLFTLTMPNLTHYQLIVTTTIIKIKTTVVMPII